LTRDYDSENPVYAVFFYCRATGKPATATRPAPDRRPRKACAGRERSCRWGCRRDRTLRLARQLLRGGRAHRESVPTGRACPPGGRAHREGVPTGRARVAALESQPALWVIKSFRWHQPAIQTTHCTPRLARGTAGHEIGVIFTYPSSNQMCTR